MGDYLKQIAGGVGNYFTAEQTAKVTANQAKVAQANAAAATAQANAKSAWTKYIPAGLALVGGIALLFLFRRKSA